MTNVAVNTYTHSVTYVADTRYVPVLDPRFSYRAEDVVRALEQVCPMIG